jgi:uncharacterized protein
MFILPPNCIVPSATSLTISPVFPSFLYFTSHTPSAANENRDGKSCRIDQSERLSAFAIFARAHFRGITVPRVSITGEIIVAHPPIGGEAQRSREQPVALGDLYLLQLTGRYRAAAAPSRKITRSATQRFMAMRTTRTSLLYKSMCYGEDVVVTRPTNFALPAGLLPKIQVMKFLDPDTESAVRDFLARIPADIRLDRAILFGSRARGEHTPDSDADVALILHERGNDGKTLTMLAGLAYYSYLDTGIMVQPVPIALEDWLNPENSLGQAFSEMSSAKESCCDNDTTRPCVGAQERTIGRRLEDRETGCSK